MAVTLSIWGENAFKEFLLPSGSNMETAIVIRRDIFQLSENIIFYLENMDGQWSFRAVAEGCFLKSGRPYDQSAIGDGDCYTYQQRGKTLLAILVQISGRRFCEYEKYQPRNREFMLGTAPECAFRYSFDYEGAQYITRHHALFSRTRSGFYLKDQSRNGIFVNSARVHDNITLKFGDRIDVWGLSILVLGSVLAVRKSKNLSVDLEQMMCTDLPPKELQENYAPKLFYHRSPRRIAKLMTDPVNIDAPPASQEEKDPPLLMAIGPALSMAIPMVAGSGLAVLGSSMGGVYMYTGIVTSVLSAIIGSIWALINVRYNRKNRKERENLRFQAYSDYLIRLTEQIRQDYLHNRKVLLDMYPSALQCVEMGINKVNLWERNIYHADFLCYRLGLGDCPFQREIRIPSEKFEMVRDSLREKPRMIKDNFLMLHQVPVCVDMQKERLIGLVGGPDLSGAYKILYNLVAQIAVQNCYTDVKLVFIYKEDQGNDTQRWEYCRWLPHVWSEDRKTRYIAGSQATASEVLYELAAVLRTRSENKRQNSRTSFFKPWYIVVLEDSAFLENEPIAKYLLDPAQELGVTTMFLANQPEELPNACECVIRNDAGYQGMYHTRAADMESGSIQIETVESTALEKMSRTLCVVEVNEMEVGGEIPASITFFDMYGVSRPSEFHSEERWKLNRNYENMRALIGQKNGGLPCYLDAHEKYHGPHGLVAGTTGSGKSETLQTYILSLALSFSPYDVGFFLIDYKGGGMANLFGNLPHMLGSISNLSGAQIQRAMVSIKSENLRRQQIFNENGVNNINLYTTLYKNGEVSKPVPHLFIIIDEFAELKRDQPDFMRELISVAQVGRSLGVHLILATQKPSGTVDDNIWSNAKFRLCLRVQDRQDSMDMLHKPDAAYLTQAGRGFLQVGSDEVFEQFQSGWSGARYDPETIGRKQVLAKMLSDSGKMAVVGNYTKRQQMEKIRQIWLCRLVDLCKEALEKTENNTDDFREQFVKTMQRLMDREKIEYTASDSFAHSLLNLLDLYQEGQAVGFKGKDCVGWISEIATLRSIRIPERKEKTQLDATVDYLHRTAEEQGYKPLSPLWLPPLPVCLYYADISPQPQELTSGGYWPEMERKWELAAIVGRVDDPQQQRQLPAVINFSRGGHHALIGAVSSGKSTFVQTLIYALIRRYSPDYLNIYILDYSNRMTQCFAEDVHVGGIVFDDVSNQAGRMFYLLHTMLAERKELFHGGTYEQYVLSHGVVCPTVLLIIDNIANFREKTGEAFDQELIRIAREGAAYGIYLFITGSGFSISEIPSRLADHIRSTLCLELSNSFLYADVFHSILPQILPESGVPGRGLINQDGRILEFQTALPLEAVDMYERADVIRSQCLDMASRWTGQKARMVPEIPEKPTWADFVAREEMSELFTDKRYLPLGYDYATAGIYSVDLRFTYCFIVSGRARTGKTNVLSLLMRSAKQKGMYVSVLEPEGNSLQSEAQRIGAERYTTLDEIVSFIGQLGQTFRTRHAILREMVAAGAGEEEQFVRMSQEQPWLVVIPDLVTFVSFAMAPQASALNVDKAMENLIGKGFMHNIFFVIALNQDNRSKVAGLPLYEEFVKEKCGIHLGGNVAAQQLFEFQGMQFKEQNLIEKPGVGLIPPINGEPFRRVVLPLVKG